MKKILIGLQILLNIAVIFLIPMVPVTHIGGMMQNGMRYSENINMTIFETLANKINRVPIADSYYRCSWNKIIFYILILIVFNVLICFFIKINKNIIKQRSRNIK